MNIRKPSAFFFLVLFVVQSYFLSAQLIPVDTIFRPKRFAVIAAVESGLIAGSLTGLYYAWYKDCSNSDFHEFNDNAEWLQVDKFGHSLTSYNFGKNGYDFLRGSGISKEKSLIFGGGIGLFYLSTVEVLDGFSSGWGFSWGDMAANTLGTALFVGQQWVFDNQLVMLKFSYHPTDYAQFRPSILGTGHLQRFIKDYNGQTLWLSGNIGTFLPEKSKFPKWINFAIGYGVDGMLGGFSNPVSPQYPVFERNRQYYLSLDIDFTRIRVKNLWLKAFLNAISFVKLPFPTIEFGKNGTQFHPIYF